MVSIVSESEGKANPHERINEREQENNREKILDNCKLGLDVVVVHGGYSTGRRGRLQQKKSR
jgi:hypothetical protein